MPLRFVITKATGTGENCQIDLPQWNPVTGEIMYATTEEMERVFDEALKFVDTRASDLNLRLLEAYDFQSFFPIEIWQQVRDVLDVISGKQSAYDVTRRWNAAKEETEALEQGRLAYALDQQMNGEPLQP